MTIPAGLVRAVDASVWAATVTTLLFVVQYTLSSPWWRDPVGRTIVAEAFGLLVLLVPTCVFMVDPALAHAFSDAVLDVVSLFAVSVTMAWRCVVWWVIKPPRLLRKKPIRKDELSS